jgi:hypothetical protein
MSARPRQLGWPCSQISSIGRQGDQDQLQTWIGKRGLTTLSKKGETPTVSRNASGTSWGLRGPKYSLKASAVQKLNRCSRAGGRVEQNLTTNYLRNISKLRQASSRRGQACVQRGRLNVGLSVRACIGLPMASPFTTRHRMRSAVARVATLSALTGCVVGPNYKAPQISLTAFHTTASDNHETDRPMLDS